VREPFNLNEDGEISYSRISIPATRTEGVVLTVGMISTEGFALESFASRILRSHTSWVSVYEQSRLLHPAIFDAQEDIVIPHE
jgi:hypothetical protein